MKKQDYSSICFTKKSSPRLCFWLGVIAGALMVSLGGLAYIGYLYAGGAFVLKQDDISLEPYQQTALKHKVTDINATDISLGKFDYILGNDDAKVTLMLYTDFECQLCKIYHKNLVDFVKSHENKVKLVVKNFVLTQKHPEAYNAAVAAICAGEQEQYYDYADALFNNQSQLSDDYYDSLATEMNLNMTNFKACRDNENISEKIDQDYEQGLNLGVRSIPYTVVVYPDDTMKLIDGNVSKDFLSSLLKEYL